MAVIDKNRGTSGSILLPEDVGQRGSGKGGSVRGVVGHIKWSYFDAAAINGYTVTRNKAGKWTMSGHVVMSDAFKMSQRPLIFVATHDKGAWRWPLGEFSITDGRIRADLGEPLP